MNTNESNARAGSGRVWLWSAAFWLFVGLASAALTVAQRWQEVQPGTPIFTWRAFSSFEALWTFVPYVPGTVWLWWCAARLVEIGGRRERSRAATAVVATAGMCTIWNLLRYSYGPVFALPIGMFLWSLLHFAGILGVSVAWHATRVASERQRELLATQLRALRAQLQPHFLFNTLHAIGVTAKADGVNAARMTTLLGDLLRQTLRERDGGLVSLAEECELLQPYLQLQQLRFGDRLRIDVDVPAEALAGAMPDLLLQPLVENALQHGIEQRPGSGHVRIVGRRVGDRLLIDVHDDGVGLTSSPDGPVLGTGLGATKLRLAALHGDGASLSVRGNDQGGTTASLVLPFREVAHAA